VIVVCVQPGSGFGFVAADEGIERSKEAKEEEGELAFFSVGVESAAGSEPGDRCFAGADDFGKLTAVEVESLGSVERGLGEDRGW
jgi:hypothetical protein